MKFHSKMFPQIAGTALGNGENDKDAPIVGTAYGFAGSPGAYFARKNARLAAEDPAAKARW
jgi:hypothetical protein